MIFLIKLINLLELNIPLNEIVGLYNIAEVIATFFGSVVKLWFFEINCKSWT